MRRGASRLGGLSFVFKKSSAGNPNAIRMQKKVHNRTLSL